MEIERKFLVGEIPDAPAADSKRLRQGYIATGEDAEVRVRDEDGCLVLTLKSGAGMVRGEIAVVLSPEQFEILWPVTEGRRVEKRRTSVPLGRLVAEIDVYEGGLEGLAVVEVEFTSAEEARAFVPPSWFGREVTDDPAYKNASLALNGRPEV